MLSAQKNDLKGRTGAGLFETCSKKFLPPLSMTVAAYAEAHRFLPSRGGGVPERWRNAKVPYLEEPMCCLDSGEYLTEVLVGPGQVAKTVAAENWFLKSVATDPANFLWYMQSDEALEAYVKDRINPMIDDHDVLRSNQGLRPIDDSLHYKRFRGMSLQLLTASMSNLISKSAPRIVADEIDAYRNIFGDIKVLLDVRRQTFGDDSMLFAISHPDLAKGLKPETDWTAGIMSMYADSTRCIWWWDCPSCREWSSPNPIAARVMSIEYPVDASLDEVEAGAFLQCPNGCVVPDSARFQMNSSGIWVGDGEELTKSGRLNGRRVRRKTSGHWIVGAMSPFVLGGIGALARAKVKAERERDQTGEDKSLRQVIVKQWGIPYAPTRKAGSIEADDLADRAESDLKLGLVPDGVRFLVCSVDSQASTFEYLVRGFGVGGESWIIDRGKILADPATSAEDWDKLLELFSKLYPLADGTGRAMGVRACGFDISGTPGTTQQAYAAWLRWRRAKKIRLYGKVGPREAWSVLGLKGASGINAPKLQISYPDTSRKASTAVARGEVPIGLFNPNLFKDDLSGQLQKANVGALYVHFPYELRGHPGTSSSKARSYPIDAPHIWFEQAVAERQLNNGRWEKLNPSARNEALDLLVMSHILAHLHGLSRINWERPPPWAAAWDVNVLVTAAAAAAPAGGTATAPRKGGKVTVTIDPTAKKTIASRLA